MPKKHASKLTQIFRSSRMVLHTLYGLFVAGLILPRLSPLHRDVVISRWSKALLDLLNIRVIVLGDIPPRNLTNTMFVANHISWVDIHALNSVHTTRFVAKAEIRKWPVFGFFATKVNTLFVEREKRHEAGKLVSSAKQALQAGDCICFFPEGTTTDGTEIKPFKGSLLQAAIDTKSNVWPFAIHYPDADNKPNTEMAYWGEMSLIESMQLIIKQRSALVVLNFASPMNAGDYDRRKLSMAAREAIVSRLDLPR
ncbi:MAG: lysophospholipid acyltransferase family protein [Nitrosomonadales bacterium]|nr:lysophospholipid acyltransferase family protein [Nitrosomonadales bacterium]